MKAPRPVALYLPPILLAKAQRLAERSCMPIHDVLVEMIALGIYDVEESDSYETVSYH